MSFEMNLLAHEAISFDGRRSGFISLMLGIAGDEYPRTRPIQKYDMETHKERIVWDWKIHYSTWVLPIQLSMNEVFCRKNPKMRKSDILAIHCAPPHTKITILNIIELKPLKYLGFLDHPDLHQFDWIEQTCLIVALWVFKKDDRTYIFYEQFLVNNVSHLYWNWVHQLIAIKFYYSV